MWWNHPHIRFILESVWHTLLISNQCKVQLSFKIKCQYYFSIKYWVKSWIWSYITNFLQHKPQINYCLKCLISKKRTSPIFFVCNTWMSHLQHTFRERTLIPSPCECQTVLVSCSYETEHTRQEWEEQNTEQDQNHGGHGLHQWGCWMVEACGIVTEPKDRGCKVG